MTIWKFPLRIADIETIWMPASARILSVQAQGNVLCLWALVDPGMPAEIRQFRVYGTGHPVEEMVSGYTFLGTVQFAGGSLVFHVFEMPVPTAGK